MKPRLFSVLGLLSAALLGATPDPFAALPQAVQPFVERGEISGAVMLLATKDRVLTVAAVGQSDLASGRRMKTSRTKGTISAGDCTSSTGFLIR